MYKYNQGKAKGKSSFYIGVIENMFSAKLSRSMNALNSLWIRHGAEAEMYVCNALRDGHRSLLRHPN